MNNREVAERLGREAGFYVKFYENVNLLNGAVVDISANSVNHNGNTSCFHSVDLSVNDIEIACAKAIEELNQFIEKHKKPNKIT